MLCGNTSSVKHTDTGRCALPRYCGAWTCPACMPGRLTRLSEELAGGAPLLFLTLTWAVRPGFTPEDAARRQRQAWAKYVASYNREHGPRALQYMAVCEATKNGWPHLHILCRVPWIKAKELSAFMERETGSPMLKLLLLKSVRNVAKYLAKYMAKGPRQFGTLKRYWRTLGYLLPAFFEDRQARRRRAEWTADPRTWQEIGFDAALRGFRVDQLQPGVLIHAKKPP